MRVKCPNSDIYLELPDDRMDMKFTCPACKKIHRVTITVSSPGEVAVTPKRTPPPMPKKYATGAYPPVVDIPIDADFVLYENERREHGIDLSQAAGETPIVDRQMSSRKTEILRDPPSDQNRQNIPGQGPTPSQPQSPGETDNSTPSSPLNEWLAKEQTEHPRLDPTPTPAPQPVAAQTQGQPAAYGAADSARPAPGAHAAGQSPSARYAGASNRYGRMDTGHYPQKRKKKKSTALFSVSLIALVLLAIFAFLGWQQYMHADATVVMNSRLDNAKNLTLAGEILRAADVAKEAGAINDGRKRLYTAENVWNRIAGATGLSAVDWSGYRETEKELAFYADRNDRYQRFAAEIEAAKAEAVAEVLEKHKSDAELLGDAELSRLVQYRSLDRFFATFETGAAINPELALREIYAFGNAVRGLLPNDARERLEEKIDAEVARQGDRLRTELSKELMRIDAKAASSDMSCFDEYAALTDRLSSLPAVFGKALFAGQKADPLTLLDADNAGEHVEQLAKLHETIVATRSLARSILSAEEPIDGGIEYLFEKARNETAPNPDLAGEAARRVEAAGVDGEKLLAMREDLYFKLQTESRRGSINAGTMLAWSILRSAFRDGRIEVDPDSIDFDAKSARAALVINGVPLVIALTESDAENMLRAKAFDYDFSVGWSPLFYKPLTWMAEMAGQMRDAGVEAEMHPQWEIMEGPGGLLAMTPGGKGGASSPSALGNLVDAAAPRNIFFDRQLLRVTELSVPDNQDMHGQTFRDAAKRLHDGVMGDESIPQQVRQALKPILLGTYLPIDQRDYFDTEFCRRLIEANYLETYIDPMPAERQAELTAYRAALSKLEAGFDSFYADLETGERLYAVMNLEDSDALSRSENDQDPDSGEALPRYSWRLEADDKTTFFSPLPSRIFYAFMLAEHYPGKHDVRPVGLPERSEVWHATRGMVASYAVGEDKASGIETAWNDAIAADVGGQMPGVYGPPGWNFPLHVLVRNDQGDPMILATLSGVVYSPDFSAIDALEDRRAAQEAWLDSTAATLDSPGELGLIFHQFFRYCSDSPLPEMPNLIGSHFGHLDTHQTVYESLERKWVGRLIGDCDDLAEFFQVLTARQGKLSHVMNLPAHAACGYVDKLEDGTRRFVVLQTGQVLQFEGPTLNAVVDKAYRSFDRSGGESHLTMDAVPIFLRFADEETRTPFVLSARIYEDREYAETMIRIQAYWHEHVFSAAIREMEEMIKTDEEIGNVKELGSLYQQVGLFDKSNELRRRELELVGDDVQARLSTLLEIAQLHIKSKNKVEAVRTLGEMEAVFKSIVDKKDAGTFMRVMSFRSYCAILLATLGEPGRAWELVKYDVDAARSQSGYVSAEPVLRTLIIIYDKMGLNREGRGKGEFTGNDEKLLETIGREIENAVSRGLFKSDDYYNLIIMRYYLLGRYAVARAGRDEGLALLNQDGPYPTEQKDHTKRGRDIVEEDWSWFRIAPLLYLSYGLEMLDKDENPELYDPENAKPLLENVFRAVEKGTGLGSDIAGSDDVIRSQLTLSFLNQDLAAFRSTMATVKDKDYSRLYDDAALTFGDHCALVPLEEFAAWFEAFREFFPGKQHYFKVVYRAIDKENFDHALMMAEATARFFPDEKLLVDEAEYVRALVPKLREQKNQRENSAENAAPPLEEKPAA